MARPVMVLERVSRQGCYGSFVISVPTTASVRGSQTSTECTGSVAGMTAHGWLLFRFVRQKPMTTAETGVRGRHRFGFEGWGSRGDSDSSQLVPIEYVVSEPPPHGGTPAQNPQTVRTSLLWAQDRPPHVGCAAFRTNIVEPASPGRSSRPSVPPWTGVRSGRACAPAR